MPAAGPMIPAMSLTGFSKPETKGAGPSCPFLPLGRLIFSSIVTQRVMEMRACFQLTPWLTQQNVYTAAEEELSMLEFC
jgi:hypothetical protein